MLPKVAITLVNGALGRTTATADGVAGLVATGIATGALALNTPKAYFSLEQVEADGFDQAYDTANNAMVYQHCKDFYDLAGTGAELWLIVVSPTTTLAAMVANATTSPAYKLLQAAGGRIRLATITRVPDGTYVPVFTSGIDQDVLTAIPAAHALAEIFAEMFQPVRFIIEGRAFQGTISTLPDLRTMTKNRAAVVIGSSRAGTSAFAGRVAGRAAALPVQRKISRVKDGEIGISESRLSDGSFINEYTQAELDLLHDKGYIFARSFIGKDGFFFSSDPMACSSADDYSSLARGRVIDKAIVLAYTTYVEELEDEVDVDPETGRLPAAVIKGYQARIDRVIVQQMQTQGEISGLEVVIDPLQNVLATDTVEVELRLVPKGYSSTINVKLGFKNPLNA